MADGDHGQQPRIEDYELFVGQFVGSKQGTHVYQDRNMNVGGGRNAVAPISRDQWTTYVVRTTGSGTGVGTMTHAFENNHGTPTWVVMADGTRLDHLGGTPRLTDGSNFNVGQRLDRSHNLALTFPEFPGETLLAYPIVFDFRGVDVRFNGTSVRNVGLTSQLGNRHQGHIAVINMYTTGAIDFAPNQGDGLRTSTGCEHVITLHCAFETAEDECQDSFNGVGWITDAWNQYYDQLSPSPNAKKHRLISMTAQANFAQGKTLEDYEVRGTVTWTGNYMHDPLQRSPQVKNAARLHHFNNVWYGWANICSEVSNRNPLTFRGSARQEVEYNIFVSTTSNVRTATGDGETGSQRGAWNVKSEGGQPLAAAFGHDNLLLRHASSHAFPDGVNHNIGIVPDFDTDSTYGYPHIKVTNLGSIVFGDSRDYLASYGSQVIETLAGPKVLLAIDHAASSANNSLIDEVSGKTIVVKVPDNRSLTDNTATKNEIISAFRSTDNRIGTGTWGSGNVSINTGNNTFTFTFPDNLADPGEDTKVWFHFVDPSFGIQMTGADGTQVGNSGKERGLITRTVLTLLEGGGGGPPDPPDPDPPPDNRSKRRALMPGRKPL